MHRGEVQILCRLLAFFSRQQVGQLEIRGMSWQVRLTVTPSPQCKVTYVFTWEDVAIGSADRL